MAFADLVKEYEARFATRGEFTLEVGQALEAQVAAAGIPEAAGVFLVFGQSEEDEGLLYIGRAGTMRTDGTLTDQDLSSGMLMKQYGKPRPTLWPRWLEEYELQRLVVRWFVTLDDEGQGTLPAKALADLLQAFYDENGELPPEVREA